MSPRSGSGSTAARPRVIVVGVGNTFYGDDGLGYCLAEAIQACGGVEGAALASIQALNPGHASLLEGYDYAVFIDVYMDPDMPEDADIAVHELDPSRLDPLDLALAIETIEPHSLDPLKMLALARAAGVFEGGGVFIGVRPGRIEFGAPLSAEARRRALKALRELRRVLERAGARLRAEEGCVARFLEEKCRGPLLDTSTRLEEP